MIRKLHAHGFSQVDSLLRGLSNLGWTIDPGARILDFGCGAGGTVYEWRDRGYDACGFDLIDTVALRDPADRRYFSYLETPRVNPSDTQIADDAMHAPYESASFDLIYSLAVVEHCYALDGMMAECARLLKPGGVSLHVFPSRNQLIEPHFYVPFGGRIQSDAWLRLWARLGVRNAGQRGMTAEKVAEQNRFYCDTGLCYRPAGKVQKVAENYFSQVWYAGGVYNRDDNWRRRVSRYWTALRNEDVLAALNEAAESLVMIALRPKHGAAASGAVERRSAAE
jgi:SAM-dependent methyltransferase